MANNRVYIRCTECGRILMIAKHLGDGYYWHHEPGEMYEERLIDFLNEHWHWDTVKDGLTGCVNYEIAFEIHPDRRKKVP